VSTIEIAPLDPLRGYSVAQVCEFVPCSRTHLYRAMRDGRIRYSKDGSKVLIMGQSITNYLLHGDGSHPAAATVHE